MSVSESDIKAGTQTRCYHCNETCEDQAFRIEDKTFCCYGCKTVYEILQENGLDDYYKLAEHPGISLKENEEKPYDFLDNPQIKVQLLNFKSPQLEKISFSIPAIYCSACILLLENLHKIDPGIKNSRVNFLKKEVSIDYNPKKITLKRLVLLLNQLGYVPEISLESSEKKERKINRKIYIRLGVAGFCFGNIMLLSFPDYFGFTGYDLEIKRFMNYLNLLLALPVIFYSSEPYFTAAYLGLKKKYISIDVPISLGILALFLRSSYEVLAHVGMGYFDSLAGLVFFLLIGKWYQAKTYSSLSFERDYKSYFPLGVTVVRGAKEQSVHISKLKKGDEILVRNRELIPCDCRLLSEEALIDYSFVSGEAKPETKHCGDYLFAGGKQIGNLIRLVVEKEVSQSYLTQLWNQIGPEKKEDLEIIINRVSKYFTAVILGVAFIAGIYWWIQDPDVVWQVFTAVLIVTCPCALALSSPFTYGNAMRILGRQGFYLKNAQNIERLSKIDTIVFDKTGTLTTSDMKTVRYQGAQLSGCELAAVKLLTENSTHPLSKQLNKTLPVNGIADLCIKDFKEFTGKGISGRVNGNTIYLGNLDFLGKNEVAPDPNNNSHSTAVHLAIDKNYRGSFTFSNELREGIDNLLKKLSKYELVLLSGDKIASQQKWERIFPRAAVKKFGQSPVNKLRYVKQLKKKGRKILMIGDGLNDAGALKESDVGVAVNEDINAFTPASDGILKAAQLEKLNRYLIFSKNAVRILIASFALAFIYNIGGLILAVSAQLTPVIAAILMPLSSITIVAFTTGMIYLNAKWNKII